MSNDDQEAFAYAERLRRMAVEHLDLMARIEDELDDMGEPDDESESGYISALLWVLGGAQRSKRR